MGKGIVIGVYQVEGETAILLDRILLENTSLTLDSQVRDRRGVIEIVR